MELWTIEEKPSGGIWKKRAFRSQHHKEPIKDCFAKGMPSFLTFIIEELAREDVSRRIVFSEKEWRRLEQDGIFYTNRVAHDFLCYLLWETSTLVRDRIEIGYIRADGPDKPLAEIDAPTRLAIRISQK